MKDLIKELFDFFGWDTDIQHYIIISILAISIILIIISNSRSLIKFLVLRRNQKLLNRDLHPYYSPTDVDQVTRYFIPLRFQNVSPSEDEEPGRYYIASAKNPIIPLFLKKISLKSGPEHKYYLVLADAGMGKTTLLINLYIAYKNKQRNILSNLTFDIKLFPLGRKNILKDIAEVEDKGNTILLLDAFDEDLEALQDYRKRLNKILETVQSFRAIIITCRTQFFPSKEEEPHETGYRSYGEEGQYKFQKLYLSVFDEKDVTKYLRKRFSLLWQKNSYKKAKTIVAKSPNLVVRPMLLSHINDLVDSHKTYEYGFQVYEELIRKWIEREANKPKITERFSDTLRFRNYLHKFSESLAIYLYVNREAHGGYFLPKGKQFSSESLSIQDIGPKLLGMEDKIHRTKSLLNRDSIGNYKFSHRSILEYFLALSLFRHELRLDEFDFRGMDAAKRFYNEMITEKVNQYISQKHISQFNITSNHINSRRVRFPKVKIFNIKEIDLKLISIFVKRGILTIRDAHNFRYTLLLEYLKLLNQEELNAVLTLTIRITNIKSFNIIKFQDLIRQNGLNAVYQDQIQFLKLNKMDHIRQFIEMDKSGTGKMFRFNSNLIFDIFNDRYVFSEPENKIDVKVDSIQFVINALKSELSYLTSNEGIKQLSLENEWLKELDYMRKVYLTRIHFI